MSRLAEDGFARAALQSGCRFSAGLAEARALMATSRPELAEEVFARVAPAGPGEIIKLALVRARNLFWALDRPAEAEVVLRRAEEALGTPVAGRPRRGGVASGAAGPSGAVRTSGTAGRTATAGAAELHALRARFAFAQGDPLRALTMAAPIECSADVPEAARVRAAVAMAEALAVCGRRDDAVAIARRWQKGSERRLLGAQALAHWLAGSLTEAAEAAEAAYATATDPQGHAVSALLLGHIWLSRGQAQTALRWFRESSVLLRSCDPVRMRPAALAGIAQAAAQAGDAARAHDAIAELDRTPHPAGRGVGEELGLARAWAAHVCGDRAEAIRIATAVANAAAARGASGFAVRALHELCRLGDPAAAAPRLEALAETVDGPFAPLAAAHAAAHDDPAALLAVADRFRAFGAPQLAAEAVATSMAQ